MKNIIIKIWIWLALMLTGEQLLAQTVLPKVLTSDLQLDAGENYLVVDSLWVPDAYRLSIGEGVQIEMREGAYWLIEGGLEAMGTTAAPIVFKAETNSWQGILLRQANGLVRLENCKLQGAKASANFIAAFTAFDSDVVLEGVHFSDNRQCVYVEGGDLLRMRYCQFAGDNSKEHVNVRNHTNCLVDHCEFRQVNGGDAIDFDQVTDGIISNCYLEAGVDDGIDIGEQSENIRLENNQIFDFFENGITVGEESITRANYNLVVGCAKAIEAKDGGVVRLLNNTLDRNDYGFAGFDFMPDSGGGEIWAENTIISNNQIALTQGEDLALRLSYCLSNTHFLGGSTNLFADPLYIDAAARNYELQAISPCINQGNPESMPDPDLSRTDIGAFPTNNQDLIITPQNFPNPFDQQTIFSYELLRAQAVRLVIYDSAGRQLALLIDGRVQDAGKYYYHWLTESLAAGVYFYELTLDGVRQVVGKAVKL